MNFDHPPSAEELSQMLRDSKKADPTSVDYERILIRPCLNLPRVAFFTVLTLVIVALMSFGVYGLSHSVWLAVGIGGAILLLSILVFLKRILIFLVKVYQRFAPAKLRERCRYEPSCSQYMILSIEKYGAVRGAYKGIRRWRSCRPPNGGFDMP